MNKEELKAGAESQQSTNADVPMSSQTIAKPNVSSRFSVIKTILSDFVLFAIVDNEQNKVVCHFVYDNGEEYCEEMANKMLAGLNGG